MGDDFKSSEQFIPGFSRKTIIEIIDHYSYAGAQAISALQERQDALHIETKDKWTKKPLREFNSTTEIRNKPFGIIDKLFSEMYPIEKTLHPAIWGELPTG